MLAQHKAVWADEKEELRKRIDQLEVKVKESKTNQEREVAEHLKVRDVGLMIVTARGQYV